MCSYPFRKTTKLEEIISNKSLVYSLMIKDFSLSKILMDSMHPKAVPFFLLFEINQNLTKSKQNKMNPKKYKAISLFMYRKTKK